MELFKVVIGGSRSFRNFGLMCLKLDKILQAKKPAIEVVTTGIMGAFQLAEQYGELREYLHKQMKIDWGTHGRKAILNSFIEMAEYADACVLFYDGNETDTLLLINEINKRQKPLRVVYTNGRNFD